MRRRRSLLVGLSELIPKVYPSSEPEEMRALRVFTAYCKSVSERVLENARPVRFQEGVLMINTSTSTWANALSLESTQILADTRRRAKGVKVTRLVFRSGPLPELPKLAPLPAKLVPIGLDQLPDMVARELAGIADDALREAVTRAAVTALSLKLERKDQSSKGPHRKKH
jgi:hypothetical protein